MTLPPGEDFVLRILPGELLELRGPRVQAGPVAFVELKRASRRARAAQTRGKANPRFGQFFFDLLPHAIRQALQQAARHAPIDRPPRLLVTGGPTTRAQFLPWEALKFGVAEYPQATGRLRIVRWIDAPPVHRDPLRYREHDRWRVLILIGDVRQEWGRHAAQAALARALTRIAESLKPPVELRIAAPSWLVERHPGLPWISFERLDQLFAILQDSWHAVHFLGHSDGLAPASGLDAITSDARAAQNLLFQLDADPDSAPVPWPIPALVTSLRYTETRALVLGACLTQEHLAAPLLEVVDHVVGNQARVSPEVAAGFCGPFYTALSRLEPVSSAAAAAHQALRASHPHEFWIPALWTRNLDDQPVLDPERMALRTHADDVARRMSQLHGPLTAGLSCDDVLASVYVELDVLPDEEGRLRRAQFDKAHGADSGECADGWHDVHARWPHATRPTLEQIVREPQAGWFSGRYYLFGHAADGKTTALRQLARTLASERPLQLLPCFHTLQEVVDGLRLKGAPAGWWNRVSGEEVVAHLLDQVPGNPAARLRELRNQGRLVVLLDSLDEVAEVDREAARRVVDVLDQVLGHNVLVVTSRSIGFVGQQESRFRAIVLQGLLPEDREALVCKWCDILWRDRESLPGLRAMTSAGQFADALLAQIHKSPGLRHATTNPLTVALLVRLAADTEPPPGQLLAELPRRREVIYRVCIRFLLGSRHRRKEPVPDEALDAGIRWLRRIALWLLERGRTTVQRPNELQHGLGERDDIMDLMATWDAGELLVAGAPWRDVSSFRTWLENPAGLFVDKGGGACGFAPKVFQDALAAEALVERYPRPEDLVKEVRSRLGPELKDKLRLWGETLALVTSQLDKPEQPPWLEGLQRIDRALALRALAGADLDQDVVRGFFQWSEDAEERRKVMTELGAQLEDNEVLRPVVETIAGCTTNGGDLWHLDQLLRGRGIATDGIDARLLAMSAPKPETWRGQFARIPTPKEFFGDRDWFLMGSPEAEKERNREWETLHEVVLTQPFHLGRTPVTIAQYLEFDPGHRQWCFDRKATRPARELVGELPVAEVSWFEAATFARWLELHRRNEPSAWSEVLPEGFHCQLPTEAQWEWAARGGTTTRFWSGEKDADLARVGWFSGNSGNRTHAVGGMPANEWGLYDVHGNVLEWCHDWLADYGAERATDPRGPESGRGRVRRGGPNWLGALWCRSACRVMSDPGTRANGDVGFRLALSAPGSGIDD